MALGGIIGAGLKGAFGSLFGGNSVWSNAEYEAILRGEPDDALYREYKKVSTTPQYFYRAPIAKKELERRGISPTTGQKLPAPVYGPKPVSQPVSPLAKNMPSNTAMASVTKNPVNLILIVGAILAFLNFKK